MRNKTLISTMLIGGLGLSPITGCENLPGGEKEQGAVIGGAGGAAAGAAIAKKNRLLGALIGGALGAGGGYLIGSQVEKTKDGEDREKHREEAIKAHERAERSPAKASDVDRARTADLNNDGFVTLDEVVAMRQANLSDRDMIQRLDDTDQIFELTEYQEDYLRTRGVSDDVLRAMRDMNQDTALTASDRLDDRDDADVNRDDRHEPISRDPDFDRDGDRERF
jgi:hypothetical protein